MDILCSLPKTTEGYQYILVIVDSFSECLVGCFGFNGPLRQYFSLYRAVSQSEGEGEEKG